MTSLEPNGRDIEKDLFAINSLLGVTRILDKNSLFQSNLTYTYRIGFLANPYKKVFIVGGDPRLDDTEDRDVFFENRPGQRHQVALMGRYRRFFQTVDGALHIEYRVHIDSWRIHSHTFELTWHQPLGSGWRLAPRVRYYSQDKADLKLGDQTQGGFADFEYTLITAGVKIKF